MFTQIQDLVAKSTLLITASAEGDRIRLSITPTPADSKSKPAITPLSLVATAAELDEGLAEALLMWQAPKRSLLDQVAAAADDSGAAAPAQKAPVATKTSPNKPGPKAKNKVEVAGDKPARPSTAAAGGAAPGGDVDSIVAAGAGGAVPGGDVDSIAAAGAGGAVPGGDVDSSAPAGAGGAAPGGDVDGSAPAGADSAAPGGEAASSIASRSAIASLPSDEIDRLDTARTSSAQAAAPTINEPPAGATKGPADDPFTLDIF